MDDSGNSLRAALDTAFDIATAYRAAENDTPVAALVPYDLLRSRLDVPLESDGLDPVIVLQELVAAIHGGLANVTGGRFFGWVNGGSLPSALAADWLTSTWDQNASLYTVAPAACVVEEIVGGWLKDLLHLPVDAGFALVTGCQMAHVTCLAAARHSLLQRRGWNVEQDGLAGAPRIRIVASTELHGSAVRAVRLLGLGEKNIVALPSDAGGQLPEAALRAHLETDPTAPTILLLQAGDLNIGAFDDFQQLIPLAKSFGAWVHIDGAFGLWLAASPNYRHLVQGAEQADSWAADGHKWLNVPYDCGYAFVRDAVAHRAAFSHRAAYVTAEDFARDPIDWTPESSRRARGFSTYAALRELGRSGVAALIDRCCHHAHRLAVRIGSLPGAQIVSEPQINQGLVRFLHPSANATELDHDAFTDHVTAMILADGEALFSNTTWRERRAMRISVCNWQTSPEDVERTLHSVAAVLAQERDSFLE